MNKTVQYYNKYDEDNRLKRHPAEFIVTTNVLDNLIKPGDRILHLGTGTGAYALHYAQKGCSLFAEDITPVHIDILKGKLLLSPELDVTCRVGDARHLEHHRDSSFDVVLCMGPIYHLEPDDSRQCIRQCLNVLKKEGLLVIAYINKYGGYEDDPYGDVLIFHSPEEIEGMTGIFELDPLCHIPVDGEFLSENTARHGLYAGRKR